MRTNIHFYHILRGIHKSHKGTIDKFSPSKGHRRLKKFGTTVLMYMIIDNKPISHNTGFFINFR